MDNAAQSAVDVYEKSYHTTKSFFVQSFLSAKNIYNATKDGVKKIEHHLLVPVRDVVILPAFSGVERAVDHTVHFLQSEEASGIASQSLEIIRHTPLIGEHVLAPAIVTTANVVKASWQVVQYPIPSRENVRIAVDGIMTGTKWLIVNSWKEIYFYTKLVDASITRALCHTQWRVVGSGPYSTLSDTHKREVIDHLCERYLSTKDNVSRYELACHIKFYNRQLYHDLIVSGLLLKRGGDGLIANDTWLTRTPAYIATAEDIMLLDNASGASPLWFYLPNKNGNQPEGTPWICFTQDDAIDIENGYTSWLVHWRTTTKGFDTGDISGLNILSKDVPVLEAVENLEPYCDQIGVPINADIVVPDPEIHVEEEVEGQSIHMNSSFPTIAKWYEPNLTEDVLIDEKRYTVSFHEYQNKSPRVDPRMGTLRFPLQMLRRPNFWRFHSKGDEVRRGIWLLDTKRNGLQPYSEESSAILEDAYLFLKWSHRNDKNPEVKDDIDSVLLTVSVMHGDETQLVQFRSLNQITAIQKSVAGGLSLFKRRVYRGIQDENTGVKQDSISQTDREGKNTSTSPTIIAASKGLVKSSSHSNIFYREKPQGSDNVEHLVLVVHGIGEMLRTGDLLGLSIPAITASIIDCCDSLRENHTQVTDSNLNPSFDFSDHGRVEFLPIEWHEPFAIQSRGPQQKEGEEQAPSATLRDISLNTIPHLRNFTNDTMLDSKFINSFQHICVCTTVASISPYFLVLYFMSPKHHDLMVEIVCSELNTVVSKYRKLTGFAGKISLLSHSLGSVVAWDILSNQNHGFDLHSPQPIYPSLQFNVEHSFMIGSPVAVFLMMRNQNDSSPNDFQLPGCQKVFNIFHPYDPVAYRIEPLIHSTNAKVEPRIISYWKGGFRVKYQTKLWWRKIVDETEKAKRNAVMAVEAGIEGIGLLDKTEDEDFHHQDYANSDSESWLDAAYSQEIIRNGSFSQGRRLDYMLQEKELEIANEYIAALAAHSSYWGEKDLSLFLAEQIFNYK